MKVLIELTPDKGCMVQYAPKDHAEALKALAMAVAAVAGQLEKPKIIVPDTLVPVA
jgi:hypothetical protein